MIALRSPGIKAKETSRVARSPPKFLHSCLSSSTGASASADIPAVTPSSPNEKGRPEIAARPPVFTLLAELAGRIVAAVHRRLQELVLLELTELADVRISLDDRVPELFLVVAEHLLLLDLLDVD